MACSAQCESRELSACNPSCHGLPWFTPPALGTRSQLLTPIAGDRKGSTRSGADRLALSALHRFSKGRAGPGCGPARCPASSPCPSPPDALCLYLPTRRLPQLYPIVYPSTFSTHSATASYTHTHGNPARFGAPAVVCGGPSALCGAQSAGRKFMSDLMLSPQAPSPNGVLRGHPGAFLGLRVIISADRRWAGEHCSHVVTDERVTESREQGQKVRAARLASPSIVKLVCMRCRTQVLHLPCGLIVLLPGPYTGTEPRSRTLPGHFARPRPPQKSVDGPGRGFIMSHQDLQALGYTVIANVLCGEKSGARVGDVRTRGWGAVSEPAAALPPTSHPRARAGLLIQKGDLASLASGDTSGLLVRCRSTCCAAKPLVLSSRDGAIFSPNGFENHSGEGGGQGWALTPCLRRRLCRAGQTRSGRVRRLAAFPISVPFDPQCPPHPTPCRRHVASQEVARHAPCAGSGQVLGDPGPLAGQAGPRARPQPR